MTNIELKMLDSEKITDCKIDFSKLERLRTKLSFSCGIVIDMDTGEVEIPEGLALSDAAREFWRAIEQFAQPFIRK